VSADLFRVILPIEHLERADAFWERMLGLPVDKAVPARHYIPTGGAILVLVDPSEHGGVHRPLPDWLYFRVPDLDATWAAAQALGCPDLETDEGTGIRDRVWGDRSFYTRDPDGNRLCFIDDLRSQDAPHAARYAGRDVANLCKVILPASRMEPSDAFFTEMLGLEPDTSVPNRHFFPTGSCELALVDSVEHARTHGSPDEPFRPSPEVVYFAVPDLDAAWERASRLALPPLQGHDVGVGVQQRVWGERSFYGLDPAGNPICFVDDQTLYTGSS
jgi:catechol 2,3-dioxygenase-like lactoylglutathione lyase family enzyme